MNNSQPATHLAGAESSLGQLPTATDLNRSGSPSKLGLNNKSATPSALPYAADVGEASAEVSLFKALGSPSPEQIGQNNLKAAFEPKKAAQPSLPGFIDSLDPFAEPKWPQKGLGGSFVSDDTDDFFRPPGTAVDELVQQLTKANSAFP